MDQNDPSSQNQTLSGGITRRSAQKAGVVASSGLAFGGGIGTVQAGNGGRDELGTHVQTDEIHPLHHFVRAEGASEPSPKPDPDDLLEERIAGNPVDDGTKASEHDGNQLTWGEFSAVEGQVNVVCVPDGTRVQLQVTGLVPEGLYTVWVVVFASPGFVDTRNLDDAFQNYIGAAPLGKNDGSENVFRASKEGMITGQALDEPNTLTVPGPLFDPDYETGDCLLTDEFEWHLFGVFHLDDESHGSGPGPQPTLAQQFAFMFKEGRPVEHSS